MRRLQLMLAQHASWLMAAGTIITTVALVPAFANPSYWVALSQQYFAAAMLALALTPIILTGGIDLSIGSVTVFCSVVIGALWQNLGWPIGWAIAGGILTGLAAGLFNGVLVTVGVWPLVATLATRELFRGLAQTVSGDNPVTRFPPVLSDFWRTRWLGLPPSLWTFGLLLVLTYLVVHHTWLGRMIFALGDNQEAARFAGLPVRRIKLALYAWSGLTAGVCGAALVMRYGAAKADAEKSLELTAIACVVLGGVRITGGSGHVAGTLLGIVTIVVLLAGLNYATSTWRETLTGTLLIAVAVANESGQRWAERQSASEKAK
ncbi:MAG: ABC transporter permease [Gemmataceae bacterium]